MWTFISVRPSDGGGDLVVYSAGLTVRKCWVAGVIAGLPFHHSFSLSTVCWICCGLGFCLPLFRTLGGCLLSRFQWYVGVMTSDVEHVRLLSSCLICTAEAHMSCTCRPWSKGLQFCCRCWSLFSELGVFAASVLCGDIPWLCFQCSQSLSSICVRCKFPHLQLLLLPLHEGHLCRRDECTPGTSVIIITFSIGRQILLSFLACLHGICTTLLRDGWSWFSSICSLSNWNAKASSLSLPICHQGYVCWHTSSFPVLGCFHASCSI